MSIFLWSGAVATYGAGDVLTTMYGLENGAVESHPLMAPLLDQFGNAGMVVWKAGVILGFYALYRVLPEPYNLGIPIGLVLLGVAISLWNIHVSTL